MLITGKLNLQVIKLACCKRMKVVLYLILLLSPCSIFAQNIKLVVLDRSEKKPLNGISVLTENGSLVGSTNEQGEFWFDSASFNESNIKKLMFYNTDYQPAELSVISLPAVIYLEKIKINDLKAVEVTGKRAEKYFTLTGYVRSWKLINDKLVRYGDAIIDYQIPFKRGKSSFYMEQSKYIKAFRNFRMDSIKAKSRIISISMTDGFFRDKLPSRDMISSIYTAKKVKDSLYHVYDEAENIGYAIYDKDNLPAEINTGRNFEGDEAIKIALWWKIAGKSKNVEKWAGTGETRHPVYLFSDRKILANTKGKPNTEEVVTEIFISDPIIYNAVKPEKYRTAIHIDQSFYDSSYWEKEIKKHPLPGFIAEQLKGINELNNTFR